MSQHSKPSPDAGGAPAASEHPLWEAYLRLVGTHLINSYSRSEWRSCFRGEREREHFQQLVVGLAEAAKGGGRSDRFALLLGAHAILPLHGAPLRDLATLLVDHDMTDEDMADEERDRILLDTLAEGRDDESLTRDCQDRLGQICRTLPAGSPRALWIGRHVAWLGLSPPWLTAFLPPELP
jgi:hypothetical protein